MGNASIHERGLVLLDYHHDEKARARIPRAMYSSQVHAAFERRQEWRGNSNYKLFSMRRVKVMANVHYRFTSRISAIRRRSFRAHTILKERANARDGMDELFLK